MLATSFSQLLLNNIVYTTASEPYRPTADRDESGLVWSGLVWSGLVWSGLVWSGLVWSGLVWSGLVWSGRVGSGRVGSGPVRSGPVRSGPVRSGPIRSGPVRSDPIRSDPIRSDPIRSGRVVRKVPTYIICIALCTNTTRTNFMRHNVVRRSVSSIPDSMINTELHTVV